MNISKELKCYHRIHCPYRFVITQDADDEDYIDVKIIRKGFWKNDFNIRLLTWELIKEVEKLKVKK